MATATITPSMARGVIPTPRQPDLQFDATLANDWFAGDAGLTAFWNAFGVIAGIAESQFIDTGRWLLSQMSDQAVIDETTRFIQQEAQHGALHSRMNRVLATRGYPVEATRLYVTSLLEDIRRRFDEGALTAWGLAAEQAIGEVGHAVMENPDALAGADELPRSLLYWHFYEEVEHQAALYDGFMHVYEDDRISRQYRRLGALLLAISVPVALASVTWVFCRQGFPGKQNRLTTWRPLWQQLFGRTGLLKLGARNLRAFIGDRFHPFDLHDPTPTLQARANFVKPEWTLATRSIKPLDNAPRPIKHLPNRKIIYQSAGFALFTARTTWRFVKTSSVKTSSVKTSRSTEVVP